jgi:sugar phosphate isomerase/epimerase
MAADRAQADAGGMNPLGIERLCTFGMRPDDFARLAAGLGCAHIGIGIEAMRYANPHGYDDWSLRDDPALGRSLKAALAEAQVALSLVEGFGIRRGEDRRESWARDLDLVAELGGRRINVASATRDRAVSFDGFGRIAELAGERGIETVIEIGPGPVATLPEALAAVAHVGRGDFKLLVDTMHFIRFGGTAAALAAIDPALIGYVQLCDVPMPARIDDYLTEALTERLPPGEGDLPLADLLARVPDDVVVSVEVPQLALAEAGVSPEARIRACLDAARRVMEAIPSRSAGCRAVP